MDTGDCAKFVAGRQDGIAAAARPWRGRGATAAPPRDGRAAESARGDVYSCAARAVRLWDRACTRFLQAPPPASQTAPPGAAHGAARGTMSGTTRHHRWCRRRHRGRHTSMRAASPRAGGRPPRPAPPVGRLAPRRRSATSARRRSAAPPRPAPGLRSAEAVAGAEGRSPRCSQALVGTLTAAATASLAASVTAAVTASLAASATATLVVSRLERGFRGPCGHSAGRAGIPRAVRESRGQPTGRAGSGHADGGRADSGHATDSGLECPTSK